MVVWIGGPTEKETIESIRGARPVAYKQPEAARVSDQAWHFYGESSCDLNLSGLSEMLAGLDLLVSIDSGPAHLAAAVGCTVISLFGPTASTRWAPVGPSHQQLSRELSCAPCSNHGTLRCPLGTHACMKELDPELVLGRIDEILKDAPKPRRKST